jgi:hypothetical protein
MKKEKIQRQKAIEKEIRERQEEDETKKNKIEDFLTQSSKQLSLDKTSLLDAIRDNSSNGFSKEKKEQVEQAHDSLAADLNLSREKLAELVNDMFPRPGNEKHVTHITIYEHGDKRISKKPPKFRRGPGIKYFERFWKASVESPPVVQPKRMKLNNGQSPDNEVMESYVYISSEGEDPLLKSPPVIIQTNPEGHTEPMEINTDDFIAAPEVDNQTVDQMPNTDIFMENTDGPTSMMSNMQVVGVTSGDIDTDGNKSGHNSTEIHHSPTASDETRALKHHNIGELTNAVMGDDMPQPTRVVLQSESKGQLEGVSLKQCDKSKSFEYMYAEERRAAEDESDDEEGTPV